MRQSFTLSSSGCRARPANDTGSADAVPARINDLPAPGPEPVAVFRGIPIYRHTTLAELQALLERSQRRRPPWDDIAALQAGSLTPREREVMGLLLSGMKAPEIAPALSIAYLTARTHIQNVLLKLGVKSTFEAVVWWHRHGFGDLLRAARVGSKSGAEDDTGS